MEEGDTHMTETRAIDQQTLSMQLIEDLQQLKAGLNALNDKFHALPYEVATRLRGGEGEHVHQTS